MASGLRTQAFSLAAASSKAVIPRVSVAVVMTASPPLMRASLRARRLPPPRWPESRGMRWEPDSEQQTTAGRFCLGR